MRACFVHAIHASAAINSSPRQTPFAAPEQWFDWQLSKEVELCGIERKQRGVRRHRRTRAREPALPYQLCWARTRTNAYSQVRVFRFSGVVRKGTAVLTDDTTSHSNPALRSRNFPPAPAFSNPHAIRAGVLRGRRGKPSWADGWDPMKHEYAVTTSEGSGGGH